jgi:HD-GYP domain-containing protein (c-di-GMP phosphodiesterase class II)
MPTGEAMVATTRDSIGYLPISISTLLPDQMLGVRLYIRESESAVPRLYRASDVPFEQKDRERLIGRGLRCLFINASDHERYQSYLRENLPNVLKDERISVTDRFSSLNSVVRDVLATSFRDGNVDETVQGSAQLAAHCADLVSRDDCIAGELIGVLNHDYHTFTHSANVSFYCVMLAKALGIDDRESLRAIGTGGLLHDLGKIGIPERILTKPGKLSDAEYETIKDHPRIGFLHLCQRNDLSFPQLMMVYQHHERVDGGGYPVGCVRQEIHDWARLCTVVDVFEALTSNRPYRGRLNKQEVSHIMERDSGKAFDREYLECWKSVVGLSS